MLGLGMGLHKHKQKQIVRNGLVLYLDGKDFTNSPPTTSWNDRSGLGNNATPSGMAYTTSSGADGVGGVVFDGVDDSASVPNSGSLPINSSFTIETKFKYLGGVGSIGPAISKSLVGGSYEYIISVVDSRLKASALSMSFTDLIGNTVNIGDTTYAILRYNPTGTTDLFQNGNLVASIPSVNSVGPSTSDIVLGSLRTNKLLGVSYLSRIYNRALIDSEIRQNYNASR